MGKIGPARCLSVRATVRSCAERVGVARRRARWRAARAAGQGVVGEGLGGGGDSTSARQQGSKWSREGATNIVLRSRTDTNRRDEIKKGKKKKQKKEEICALPLISNLAAAEAVGAIALLHHLSCPPRVTSSTRAPGGNAGRVSARPPLARRRRTSRRSCHDDDPRGCLRRFRGRGASPP